MDFQRILVYEDKESLVDFNINDENTLNGVIHDEWLIKRTEIDSITEYSTSACLKVFNDAYYICTLALLTPVSTKMPNTLRYGNLRDKVSKHSVVFPLVRFYLSRLPSLTRSLKWFVAEIEKESKLYGWQKNYDELLVAVAGHDETINPCIFAQRQLSKNSLSKVNWKKLTGCFKKVLILKTVQIYARNKDDWQMMTDAIKAAAIQYDYDYGFDEVEVEDVDEDGAIYTKTIKVEKEPYDSDGNYCLEPLERKGVYDFCDKLKNRFEELSFKGQLSLIGQPTKGAHRSRQESQGQPNLFRENLDVGAIIEELKALVPTLQVGKNRERVIMKYVYSVFAELKWLRDTMQTHFISWAKTNRIVSFASKDIKNINVDRSDSTYDAILNSFSERQTSGKYKDKEMFYLKDAQGYTKRIYNNG